MVETDEEIIRKIGELMKDPAKWDAYIASRAEKVLDGWPTRSGGTRARRGSSAGSS